MERVDLLTCISDPLIIEEEVFNFWLSGYTVDQTVELRYKTDSTCSSFDRDIIQLDTEDQFQTFCLLEPLFKRPPALASSPIVNMPYITDNLLQQYYSLHVDVARELVGRGRKLTAKHRKDIDSISDKTNIPLKSCLRQYDNIRRIFKEVDEKEGKVSQNIHRYYGLNPSLSQQYASIIFILDNRIDVSPRKIPNLRYSALIKCVTVIMSEWCLYTDGASDMDIDRSFLKELHSLKEKIADSALCTVLLVTGEHLRSSHEQPKHIVSEMKKMTNRLLSIGYSLVHTKDFSDIFIDLEELVLVPWLQTGLSAKDLELTLNTLLTTYINLANSKGLSSTVPIFDKYLRIVTSCLVLMSAR